MQMTDHEIVQSFKEAKFPGKQITILAELNRCSKEDIFNVLVNNGVEINRRALNGGNHKAPKEPEEHKSMPLYVPECVKTMVKDELELTKLRIGDVKRDLDKYEHKAEELEEFLKEVEAYESKCKD